MSAVKIEMEYLPCWKHPNYVLFYFLNSNILPKCKSLTIFNPSMKLYIDFFQLYGDQRPQITL